MAKKKSGGGYLTPGEQIAGTVLLTLFVVVTFIEFFSAYLRKKLS